jgi:hypothetical protein
MQSDVEHEARLIMKKQKAILLSRSWLSVEDKKIARILGFFGVPWGALTATAFAHSGAGCENSSNCSLVCSSDIFLQLIEAFDNPNSMQFWKEQVHSAFVYAGNDFEILQKLTRRLTGDNYAVLGKINPGVGDFAVSDHNDFCGVMAARRVIVSKADLDTNLILNTRKGNVINIISHGDGSTFLKLEYKGVPIFLSTSKRIIDIDAELTSQNFDVREHFLSSVPLVLYVKWAFPTTCWNAPEVNACLVIDDPLLKPTHGFVNFKDLLSLMKRHKFSTNIAFIPWNWRRSAPEVVRLFRENPEHYSLSVHGCDHTRAEFGSSSEQRLYWKVRQAIERMNRHRSITGIPYDRVMVFPQGIFSEAAMTALKHTDLIAAVNNDVVSADPCPRTITISDMWDVALMDYTFPLFTRRYPWEGIENFAFDALLGKPAIAVIHHDYCSDHCARLVSFVDELNALQCAPTWRGLGDVVRRSCRQREVSPGRVEVEMYGTELRIENLSDQPKHFTIRRREYEPSAIQRICGDAQEVIWKAVNGNINFDIELNPGENRLIKISFHNLPNKAFDTDNLPSRFKTMVRRYLCEVRDNYITTARLRLAGFFPSCLDS